MKSACVSDRILGRWYVSLRAMLSGGMDIREIGRHFNVSDQLVGFRIRLAKLTNLHSRKPEGRLNSP